MSHKANILSTHEAHLVCLHFKPLLFHTIPGSERERRYIVNDCMPIAARFTASSSFDQVQKKVKLDDIIWPLQLLINRRKYVVGLS